MVPPAGAAAAAVKGLSLSCSWQVLGPTYCDLELINDSPGVYPLTAARRTVSYTLSLNFFLGERRISKTGTAAASWEAEVALTAQT